MVITMRTANTDKIIDMIVSVESGWGGGFVYTGIDLILIYRVNIIKDF